MTFHSIKIDKIQAMSPFVKTEGQYLIFFRVETTSESLSVPLSLDRMRVITWATVNASDSYMMAGQRIYFADEGDAIMFHLSFA